MENNKPKKTVAPRVDMPCQPAKVRRANFEEVALGYTREMAQALPSVQKAPVRLGLPC